jgi:hypothetical protein
VTAASNLPEELSPERLRRAHELSADDRVLSALRDAGYDCDT